MNDAVLDAREHPDRYLPLDRRSAALFLADWEPLVRGVLLRMRVRELDAALSEVFRRALQGLPEFRGESRLSSWLYRIAWREGLRQAQREQDSGRPAAASIGHVPRPCGASRSSAGPFGTMPLGFSRWWVP